MSEWYKKKADGRMTKEERKAVNDYCAIYNVDKYEVKWFKFMVDNHGKLEVVNHE